VAWLALDDDDNDPARFLTYLIAAVATLKPDFGQSSLDLLKSPQPAPAKLILTNFINEVNQFSAPFVLALDDYHVISAPAIHEAVTFLLDHLPPPMRLIITTRIDPPLPLARWRVRQQLVEIRADELRFTLAETAAFLNQVMGLNLSAANIVMLETRIEGWPAGLQMAALSMQGRGDITRFLSSFTGSHRYILDYLIDEVLQQQPPDIQEFLLKTSMLSRLAGPLCNAVLGRDNSQVMLEQLEQANLFVLPLDNERRWYRYHHLFAEALRHRLQHLHPEQEPVLHQRASIWYEQHRLIAEAIHHTLNEPDFERAAHLIEQAGQELLLRSETVTLLKWLNALPETIIQTRPRLCLFHAWTLLLNNQVAEAEQRLQTAAELEAEPALLAQVAAIRTLIALFRGDRRQANELTRQAQALLPTGDPFLRGVTLLNLGLANVMSGKVEAAQQAFAEVAELSQKSGNVMITVTIQCQMAEARIAQGRLHQALTTYQQALALATTPEGLQLPGAGQAHMGLAAIMVEWNNLEAAAGHLAEGFRLNRELGEIGAFDAYIIQANLKQAQSDAAGALAAIEQAGQIIQKFSGWVYRSVAAHRARLWLKQANLAAAAGWAADLLNQAAAAPDDDPEEAYFLYEFEQLTLARVLIAQASVALPTDPARAALQLLERLYLRAVKQGRGKSVIEILLLQALAHQAGGNNARAISLLRQALTLAEPEGFVRLFVDEGLPLAGLLYKLNASPEHTGLEAYIHKLLAACPNLPSPVSDPSSIKAGDGVEASAGPPPKGSTPDAPTESIVNPKSKIQNLIDPLTERELEILHLIAAGQSNKEIARTLVIAVGTVKKHLNSIYGKLDVHSRTQAIVQAKALNLLP
jgi:LuxR family maltose regulon positive regulatory protein